MFLCLCSCLEIYLQRKLDTLTEWVPLCPFVLLSKISLFDIQCMHIHNCNFSMEHCLYCFTIIFFFLIKSVLLSTLMLMIAPLLFASKFHLCRIKLSSFSFSFCLCLYGFGEFLADSKCLEFLLIQVTN